jgi:hypothetical protein
MGSPAPRKDALLEMPRQQHISANFLQCQPIVFFGIPVETVDFCNCSLQVSTVSHHMLGQKKEKGNKKTPTNGLTGSKFWSNNL